jgi:hypothetical protein
MATLPLNIPKQDITDGHNNDLTPEDVRHWIKDLRIDKTVESAETVSLLLEELNHTLLQKIGRYQLMESFRPVVEVLTKKLVAMYANAPLPLTDEQLKWAEQVQALTTQMLTGYKIMVSRLLDKSPDKSSANQSVALTLAIQRTLVFSGRLMLEYFRIYQQVPHWVFADMNQIYFKAEVLHLQTQPMPGFPEDPDTALSIKQVYLRNQLLTLFNPYHLLPGEIGLIYPRAGRWVNFVKLERYHASVSGTGFYRVDFMGDKAPLHLGEKPSVDIARDTLRLMDVNGLIQVFEKQIQADTESLARGKSGSTEYAGTQRDLYIRLRRALDRSHRPAAHRDRVPDSLQVVRGYSACHHLLGGEKPFEPEQEEKSWSKRATEIAKMDLTQVDHITETRKVDAATWLQKDQSAEGVALSCAGCGELHIRVGELLAYRVSSQASGEAEEGASGGGSEGAAQVASGNGSDWKLGVVRWVRYQGQCVEAGVQCLADSAWAIAGKKISRDPDPLFYQRCFITPRVDLIEKPVTLIAPCDQFHCNDLVVVSLPDKLYHLKVTDLIESTGQYERFSVITLHVMDKN